MKLLAKDSVVSRLRLPALVEKFLGRKRSDSNEVPVERVPSVNISDVQDDYLLEFALPGYDKEDIRMELVGNCLVIASEKEQHSRDKQRHLLREEYRYTAFSRAFELPEDADSGAIEAKMKNGLLRVRIPRKPGAIRQIPVK